MPDTGDILKERYRIDALLGQGGMGTVYRAYDIIQDQHVAVKELRLDSFPLDSDGTIRQDGTRQRTPAVLTREGALKQFRTEAGLLMGLSHDNLPRVHDYFDIGDQGFYVMTLVEGQNLAEVVEKAGKGLPEETVRDWFSQIASALAYCHQHGIIHRDVKPENLILTPHGKVFLVDFGIAKSNTDAHTSMTTIGARAFTEHFSPPEQRPGGSGTDQRTDIYAFGAVLYFLATGQVPLDVQRRTSDATLRLPSTLNPEISPAMESLIMRCLRLPKAERPQSIADMHLLLEAAVPASLPEMNSADRQFDQDRLLQAALKPARPSPLPEVEAKPVAPQPIPEVKAKPAAPLPFPEVRARPVEQPRSVPASTLPPLSPVNPPGNTPPRPSLPVNPPVVTPPKASPPLGVPPKPISPVMLPSPPASPIPLPPAHQRVIPPARPVKSPGANLLVTPPIRTGSRSKPQKPKLFQRRWLLIFGGGLVLLLLAGTLLSAVLPGLRTSPRSALRQIQALGDRYEVMESYALIVDTPHGLLANDRDVDMSVLSVGLATGPAHGLLKLNTDGSFTYVPEQGFFGLDTFRYQFVARSSAGETLYSAPFPVMVNVIPLFRIWLPLVQK